MNPVYVGRPMAFRGVQETIRTAAGRRKVMRVRAETEQVALPVGTAPALIDEATFQAAQVRLRLNKEQSARNNRAPELTLLRAGFIRCGFCNATMTVRRGKILRYRCGRTLQPNLRCATGGISVRLIDDAVWSKVSAILERPEIVAEELARMQQNDPTGADLTAIDRELLKIERQQANLIEQLAELGGAVGEMVRAKLTSLQAEHERLQADRAAMLSVRTAWQHAREQLGGLEQWCRKVAAKLDRLTYEEKRLALEALAVRVRVWRPGHEPHFEILATPELDSPFVDSSAGSSSRRPAARSRTPCRLPGARR
jgi:site-specific DNA recombinase